MAKPLKITVRAGIVSLLTLLIIISGGLVTYISYIGSRNSVYLVAENIMAEISSHVIDNTLNYLNPALKFSGLTQGMIDSKVISEEQQLRIYLENILAFNDQFVNTYWGDNDGKFYMAKRMPDGSISFKTVRHDDNRTVTAWHHRNPKYKATFPNLEEPSAEGYDPRKRPWYTEALVQNENIWTDIYIFASDQKPGITSAAPVYDKNGSIQGVAGIDIGIAQLGLFLSSLKIGKTGKAFLMNKSDELIAIPINREEEISRLYRKSKDGNQVNYTLLSAKDSQDIMISSSFMKMLAVRQTKAKSSVFEKGLSFSYAHGGKKYLAKYTPFPEQSDFLWLVGVVLPEEDIMHMVYRNNRIVITISVSLLLIAIILGIILSKRIASPLAALTVELDKLKNFQLGSYVEIKSPLYEVNSMLQAFHRMRIGLKNFQKYVPRDVVEELIKMGKEAVLGGEKAELTVFFSDIKDFTKISEDSDPEELVADLAIYLKKMSDILTDYKATVDKYIGDAIMAFWGAPRQLNNHAVLACHASLEFQRALVSLNEQFVQSGRPVFATRIGIHSGAVIVGNIGSEERLNYTVIGDTVNLASRLESLNKYYDTKILISEETYLQAQGSIEARPIDIVAVKGKNETVGIYELIAEKNHLTNFVVDFIALFNEGFQYYKARKWQQALSVFEEANKLTPRDKPSLILMARCRDFINNPPPADWSGAIKMKSK